MTEHQNVHSLTHVNNNDMHEWAQVWEIIMICMTEHQNVHSLTHVNNNDMHEWAQVWVSTQELMMS